MSIDINVLKGLLNKLLENSLERLEKRNSEQIKDLKYTKNEYQKQEKLLSKLCIKKKTYTKIFSKPNKPFVSIIGNKSKKNSDKLKSSLSKNKKYYQNVSHTPERSRNIAKDNFIMKTDTKYYNKNNKYNYIKARYKDGPYNKKICLTPEPKITRRKKIQKSTKNINLKPIKMSQNINSNNLYNIRNTKTIQREISMGKRTIVSWIDLDNEEMNFILEEKKKEDEEIINFNNELNNENNSDNDNDENKNDNNSSRSRRRSRNRSRSSKSSGYSSSSDKNKTIYKVINKEMVTKFGKYINSSDGHEIALLIGSFLDKKSKFKYFSCSKLLIRQLAYYLDETYQKILNINDISNSSTIDSRISNIKNKYKGEDFDSPKYAFSLSSYTVKALDLLDDNSYNKIFTIKNLEPPLDQIILIYRIFFQLIDKEELVDIESDKKFWEKTRNYILKNNNNKTGTFFRDYISEFDFTRKNIYKLKMLISGKEDKLKPSTYENICKTTGLVNFIIKDSLEYCGLIPNEKKIVMPSVIIDYLVYLKKVIKRTKEYLDMLKVL